MTPAPQSCPCCGSAKLSKLGEDITETLEVVPRQWKVIQTVREHLLHAVNARRSPSRRRPFHVTPRGLRWPQSAGDDPVREVWSTSAAQSPERGYAREGVDLSLSTLADQVRAGAAALRPLQQVIERHVLSAERLHGDDTTVPILAKGKTETGRVWTYVRDDRPFGGKDPPAASFYASRDRRGEHPERHLTNWSGVLQADAFSGYARLYSRPIGNRARSPKRYVGATPDASSSNSPTSPPTRGGVRTPRRSRRSRWRRSNASTPSSRSSARSTASRPRSGSLRAAQGARRSSPRSKKWTRSERAKLSRHNAVAKAIDYMLTRWPAFVRFLEDQRIRLTNNAAERALRGLALGRKSWLFAGSERGAERAAIMYTLI